MSQLLSGEYVDYLYEVLPVDAQKSLEDFIEKLVINNDPDEVLLTPKEYADLKEAEKDDDTISEEELIKN